MSLSELVCKTRKAARLSQAELAALAGVGKTVIWDLEHGKATLRLATLLKVLSALNTEVVVRSPVLRDEVCLT